MKRLRFRPVWPLALLAGALLFALPLLKPSRLASPPSLLRASQKPLTLLDEVGHLVRPVPAAQVNTWKQELHAGHLPASQTALLHLHLGEWLLAQQQQPEQAAWHFRVAQKLCSRSSAVYGLAAYDTATALYYEGAYQEATDAFHHLVSSKTALVGYDRRNCILWWRHASACAGYHAKRSALGIPEPPRLDPLCGAAALAACLKAQGQPFDKHTLLSACRVTGEGSTLADVLAAAKKLGRNAYPIAADDKALIALPKPLVCFVEHDHFICLLRADKRGVSYLCSDCGPWPGGKVDLTWKQWHALEPSAYAVVCPPGSRWNSILSQLPTHPTPANQPVKIASARLAGLHLGSAGLTPGQMYLLTSTVILSCGSKPNSQHCPFYILCSCDDPYGLGSSISGSMPMLGAASGDPVNLATGEEEYHPAPDLVVYNPVGPSVVWGRIYNSLRGGSMNVPPPAVPYNDFDFGMGWSHPYNVYVYDPDHTTGSTKYIMLPNGARITFTAPAVPSSATPTVHCTVEAGAPVLVDWTYVSGSVYGAFAITWPDRTQWLTSPTALDTFGQHLTQITDRNGHSIYLNLQQGYNNRGMELVSISTAPNGGGTVLLSFTYSGPPTQMMLSSVSDCYGRSVYYIDDYSLDAVSQVSQVVTTGTSNPPMRYTYGYLWPQNMGFFLQTITVPSPTGVGTKTATLNYDSAGGTYAVTSLVDANGNQHLYSYGSGSTTVTIKDSANNTVTSYSVGFNADMSQTTRADGAGTTILTRNYADPNDRYRPSSVVDSNGDTWNETWDQYGNLQTETTPRNTTTTYTWNYANFALGELTGVHTAGKQATTYSYYEPSGLLQSITSPLPGTVNGTQNVTTSFQYDGLGNILTVTAPGNNAAASITTTYNYTTDGSYNQADAIGEPITITNNLGKVTHVRYTARGQVASVTDATGIETDFAYNLADQPLQTTYPATGQTGSGQSDLVASYLYTGGPLSAVTAYDESSTQVRQVTYGYGAEGETLSISGSTEPVTLTYDGAYRLSALADGNGHVTHRYYNTAGYLDSVTYPGYTGPAFPNISGADSIHLGYDTHANLVSRTDGRGLTTTYSYSDPESLLTGITYPAGYTNLNVTRSYDSFSRLDTVSDGTGSRTYVYDDLDLITNIATDYTGLPERTLNYGRYANGQRSSLVTPAGSFSYSYDAIGRLVGLTNPYSETFAWTWLDNDWLWTQQSSNVVKATFTYNALGLVIELANTVPSNGSLLSDFGGTGSNQMLYDGVGNRLSMLANLPNAPSSYSGSMSYTFDTKDELTQEVSTHGSGYTKNYVYDPAENATTFRNTSVGYNADNQLSANSYDGDGNPTTYAGSSVGFDPEDRLTSFGSSFTNGYTAGGLRAWKQYGSTKTYFLYDGITPVCELDSSGNVSAVNTFGINGLLSRHSGGASVFYSFDPSGNLTQRLNASGGVLGSYFFDAFGNRATNDTGYDPYSICIGSQWGLYTDTEIGYVLCGHRYYDKNTGRFLNRDPIDYAGGVNLYNYCRNNPVTRFDPTGDQDNVNGSDEERWGTPGLPPDEVIVVGGPGMGGGNDSGGGGSVQGPGNGPAFPPGTIFRGGPDSDGKLTPRPSDNGMLSCRDSLSNPIGYPPVLEPGEQYTPIDPSKLPPGTVHYDAGEPDGRGGVLPPGHVSIGPNVPPNDIRKAKIPGPGPKPWERWPKFPE